MKKQLALTISILAALVVLAACGETPLNKTQLEAKKLDKSNWKVFTVRTDPGLPGVTLILRDPQVVLDNLGNPMQTGQLNYYVAPTHPDFSKAKALANDQVIVLKFSPEDLDPSSANADNFSKYLSFENAP